MMIGQGGARGAGRVVVVTSAVDATDQAASAVPTRIFHLGDLCVMAPKLKAAFRRGPPGSLRSH